LRYFPPVQGKKASDRQRQKDRQRRMRRIAATVLSIVLAGVTAFVTGLASKLANELGSSSPALVSWGAKVETAGCGWNGEVFLPRRAAERARDLPPSSEDFPKLQREPGSALADTERVNVSIQGETARTITLTGIYFHVKRRPRPPGAVFVDACGSATEGRAIVFDLDQDPPKVIESNALLHVPLGSSEGDGKPLTRPIRFPWTVSMTDPLLLTLLGKTKSSCYCIWTAEIPWVSGNRHGDIKLDNEGRGFRTVGSHGLLFYSPGEDDWTAFPSSSG
jgi:hypothetical protein